MKWPRIAAKAPVGRSIRRARYKDEHFLLPCVVKDLSRNGGRVELFKESVLPKYFLLSMMPDGSEPRLCSKVWQLARVAGIRFVENSAAT